MSSTIIQAGDSLNCFTAVSGNDGSLILQAGPTGAKINALTISTSGNISLPATAAPCFSAYQSTTQSIPNAAPGTKLQFQTKEFDTANAYDNVTNFRFTPLVAGYYQINGSYSESGTAAGQIYVMIYKNGVEAKRGSQISVNATGVIASALIFLNGSTDYAEIFVYQSTGAAVNTNASSFLTYFQAAFVRPS